MASTREAENVTNAGEQPEKVVKEKKAKAKAPKEKKKPAKNASHPPYFQMIKEALVALSEKGGSSPHAIAKYMEEKHKAVLPENFRKMLALQLKNSASKGKLTKVKASYKLCEKVEKKPADATKKPKKTTSKKPAATATAKAPKRAATVKKQAPAKKAKKMSPAKAKQPKSIKSPGVKKARKASA